MSIAAKLHILLITTILGVGLYMFLLYKEIKVFERDVADLRIKVHSILAQLPSNANIQEAIEVVAEKPVVQAAEASEDQVCPVQKINVIIDNKDDDEDDMSVTSNEIKEILTNIQDIQENEEVVVENETEAIPVTETLNEDDITIIQTARSTTPDLLELDEDQITKMKYQDLRVLLRRAGVSFSSKATKTELTELALKFKNSQY